jgi:hypothetical protein
LLVCWCRALSLTRGRVCRLQLLLELAKAVIFGSKSRGTRDHVLLSQIRDFPFHHHLWLAELRWRYWIQLPHRIWASFFFARFLIQSRAYPWKCLWLLSSKTCLPNQSLSTDYSASIRCRVNMLTEPLVSNRLSLWLRNSAFWALCHNIHIYIQVLHALLQEICSCNFAVCTEYVTCMRRSEISFWLHNRFVMEITYTFPIV